VVLARGVSGDVSGAGSIWISAHGKVGLKEETPRLHFESNTTNGHGICSKCHKKLHSGTDQEFVSCHFLKNIDEMTG
jgi:hypothetical protein